MRVDFQPVLLVPAAVLGAAGLGADVVLAERPVVRISGKRRVTFSSLATYCVGRKRPLPRTKPPTCMIAVPASSVVSLQGHCTLPRRSIFSKLTPAKLGVSAAISSMICDGCVYCIG